MFESRMEPTRVLQSRVGSCPLRANIWLGLKCLHLTNTLAYYNIEPSGLPIVKWSTLGRLEPYSQILDKAIHTHLGKHSSLPVQSLSGKEKKFYITDRDKF